MIPGPTIIKKCSACSALIEKHTIASGNTFGAIFWTDGKMDAPMLPDNPKLVKCPHCRSLVWIEKLETVDEAEPFDTMTASAEEPLLLDLDDYFSFIDSNKLLKPDTEKDVRLRAWWRGNDERRRGQHSSFSEMETQNLTALKKLLDESDDIERLILAEISRELGHFSQALELLGSLSDERLIPAVTVIKTLAEQGDSVVTQIDTNEE
jgi:hypothetical protein